MSDIVGALPPLKTYVLHVGGHPLSPNRLHAAGLTKRLQDKKSYREMVVALSKDMYSGPPFPHAEVTYTLVRTDGQFYDETNARGCVKVLEDGLCIKHGGRFLVGDKEADVTTIIRQARGVKREVRIEIRGPLPRPVISYPDERPAPVAAAKGGRRARASRD